MRWKPSLSLVLIVRDAKANISYIILHMFHKTIFLTELETALNYTCRYPSLCPQFAPLLPYNSTRLLFNVRWEGHAHVRKFAMHILSWTSLQYYSLIQTRFNPLPTHCHPNLLPTHILLTITMCTLNQNVY